MSISHATSITPGLKAKAALTALTTLISSQSPGGPLCRRGLCLAAPSRSSTSQYFPSGRGEPLTACETKLPGGYRLDRTNPDLWLLIGPEGQIVARFIAGAADLEEVERAARQHREGNEGRSQFLNSGCAALTSWLQALLARALSAHVTRHQPGRCSRWSSPSWKF